MNIPDTLERAGKIAITSFAILSAPSAYVFGLTLLFPASIRTLVDYKFLANELLTFVFFIAGLSAVVRIQFAIVKMIYFRYLRPHTSLADTLPMHRMVFRRRAGFVLVAFSVVGLMVLTSLVFSTLFQPRYLIELLSLSFGVFAFGGFAILVLGTDTEFTVPAVQSRLTELMAAPISLLKSPLSISFIVGFSLLFSFGLGAARIKSLASARDVCVELADRDVKGKMLGETNSGILIKVGDLELRSYFDFSGRFNRFSEPRHEIEFLNSQYIISINSVCD